nr:protein mono-ADP-ribosyltransferase PARP12-like [Pocillopora verrucosa]
MKEPEIRAVESPVPSHWSYTPASEPYTRVTLDSSSWEFKKVEQLFKASMSNVVVKKIDQVQNLFMWEKYRRKKDYMTQLANGDQQRVNEKRLFHGTSPDSVEAICKENFDWRLSGTATGTKYGQGSYFAVKASHSHNYAKEDANKSRFMFMAKVLVGSYVKGNPNYRRPPHKQPLNEAGILYNDSCVDDALKPTMFIVFDIDQFYPEYIIQY